MCIRDSPEGISKLIVVDEEGNEVKPDVEYVDFRPDRRVAHYRIVVIDAYAPASVGGWLGDLPSALRYCEHVEYMTRQAGSLSAFVIDADGNVVDADGPHPAPDWQMCIRDSAWAEPICACGIAFNASRDITATTEELPRYLNSLPAFAGTVAPVHWLQSHAIRLSLIHI